MGGQWEIKCIECGKLIPREGKICAYCHRDKAPSIAAWDAAQQKPKDDLKKAWGELKSTVARMREADKNRSAANHAAWAVGLLALAAIVIYFLSR